jgi:hypothetical protein
MRPHPGQTALMRIPLEAYSSAALFVSPITPCLDAHDIAIRREQRWGEDRDTVIIVGRGHAIIAARAILEVAGFQAAAHSTDCLPGSALTINVLALCLGHGFARMIALAAHSFPNVWVNIQWSGVCGEGKGPPACGTPIQAQISQRTFPSLHFSRPTIIPTTKRQSRTAIALTKPRLMWFKTHLSAC